MFADPTNNGKNGEVRALLSVPKQGAGLQPRAALFYSEQMCCGGPRRGSPERQRSAECSPRAALGQGSALLPSGQGSRSRVRAAWGCQDWRTRQGEPLKEAVLREPRVIERTPRSSL